MIDAALAEMHAHLLDDPPTSRVVELLEQLRLEHERSETAHAVVPQMLAHELGNPLTAVVGVLDLVCERAEIAEHDRAQLLERARRQAWHLVELTEDLLSVARERGEVRRHDLDRVDVAAVLAEVAHEVGHLLPADRLRVEVQAELSLRTVVPRFRRILANLVSNAARHGGELPVTVRAGVTGTILTVEVIDEGAGIDPDLADEVFSPFHRSPTSSGAGLGLYIARTLAESLGGTVVLRPGRETGTVAELALPQQRDADRDSPCALGGVTAADLRSIRTADDLGRPRLAS